MWNDVSVTKTVENAMNTAFIKKLNTGLLDPTKFGAYIIQDAVYLEKQSDTLMIASQNASSVRDREFLIGKAIKYMGYATDMYKAWQLSDSSSVKLDSACKAYTDYKISIAKTLDYKYSIVAMIPCLKLWQYIGTQFHQKENNVYNDWVKVNFKPSSTGIELYEGMVDNWYTEASIDKTQATEIYRNCMEGEFLFFDRATK